MFGSFLPSCGREQPQSTQVEGADIVMQSNQALLELSGNLVSQDFAGA
jgi:hypothetical protein